MSEISNMDDVIDSRGVIARIEELESEREDLVDAFDHEKALCSELDDDTQSEAMIPMLAADRAILEWDEENGAELAALKALAEEASQYAPDWTYGATLVRDSYFKEYAQELADDLGLLPDNAQWPANCIDWDQAARELRMDYTSVEFDGVTYWVR